jgi:hypothetical protein
MNDLMNKKLNINEQQCSIIVNNNEHISLTIMSHYLVVDFIILNEIILYRFKSIA